MELFELSLTCPGCGAECRGTVPDAFQAGQMRCGGCGRLLCRIKAIKGYVYVLSNPRMPGLVKVGCSTRSVDERVAELNSATGVPASFVVEAYFASSSPEDHEAEVHRRLGAQRVQGKEFFESDVAEAVRIIEAVVQARPRYERQPLPPVPTEQPGPPISEAGGRWSCGLCKHLWTLARPGPVEKCPLCNSTSIVRLSGSVLPVSARKTET